MFLAAATGIVAQVYYWPQIADDAFIFFRYAEHFAAGNGLRWNVGGEAVEGFSSPLWVFVLGCASLLGLDLLSTAKVLGVAAFALTATGGGLLAHRLSGNRWAGLVAFAAISLSKPLHYWAPSGMETLLYSALVVVGVALLVRGAYRTGAVVVGLAGIARPEGPLLVVLVAAAFLLIALREGEGEQGLSRRVVWPSLLVMGAPMLVYEIVRLAYFGELAPNTYYAKVGAPLSMRLVTGASYGAMGIVLWLASVMMYLMMGRRVDPTRARLLLMPLAAATALLIPVIWSGGDWMWNQRFLCPAIPVFAAGLSAMTALGWTRAGSEGSGRRPRVVTAAVAAVALLAFGAMGLVKPAEIAVALRGSRIPPALIQEGTMTEVSREVGEYLKQRSPEGSLIAVNHAGAVPYYSELPSLDMTGLNDRHIAHEAAGGLHGKFDADYVLERRPRFIVFNSRVAPNTNSVRLGDGRVVPVWYYPGYWEGETAVFRHPVFRRDYRFIPRHWVWNWSIPENYILIAERVGAGQPSAP